MIGSLIKSSYRAQVNQMPYSIVNIVGLAAGITCVVLILLWVIAETSFDNFHRDPESLYRINNISKSPNRESDMGMINAPAGPELTARFPEILQFTRLRPYELTVRAGETFHNLNVCYTDPQIFDILSFKMVEGNPERALQAPGNIVLTSSAAAALFGDENPTGKIVNIQGDNFTVTGVAEDTPYESSIQFDALVPVESLLRKAHVGWDGGLQCLTIVRLAKGTDIPKLEKEIMDYLEDVINSRMRQHGFSVNPYLQKMRDIHLGSETNFDLVTTGNLKRVISFSLVGLLILFIACVNFVNISTAISMKRSKEVSVKKIFGSGRGGVIIGFVIESGIAIVASMVLSILLVQSLLPFFNDLLGARLSYNIVSVPQWILIYLLLLILCTFLASFYSAWYLSSIAPLNILRSEGTGVRRQLSRNLLVTFQFIVSIGLIASCLVIYSQMKYVRGADMGFGGENIVVINLGEETAKSIESFKQQILEIPGVLNASASAGGIPGRGFTSNGYWLQGLEQPILTNAVYIDPDYISTMRMEIKEGRDFRYGEGDKYSLLVNETFLEAAGWDDALGKTVSRNGIDYEVVGVLRNFFTASLRNRIQPIILARYNEWGAYDYLNVSIKSDDISGMLDRFELTWNSFEKDSPFNYRLLDDMLAESYTSEKSLNILLLVLAFIAIFISSLGLFGLATFTTQARTKEIGIRKSNGAQLADILARFYFEMLRWIGVAFLIAAPVSWLVMSSWLENFAYRRPYQYFNPAERGNSTCNWLCGRELDCLQEANRNPADTLRFE
ncbi:MAG: ABC transporter permease [Bacteroidales bacterium]